MKIKNLFFASLAALTFAACSNDDAPVPEAGVTFKLTSTSSLTKAVNTTSVGAEATIKDATVYLHSTTTDKSYSSNIKPNAATGDVTINVPAGKYTVAAVANFVPTNKATLDDLKNNSVALKSNTKDNFVMFGTAGTIEVEAGQKLTVEKPIEVFRLVSAIQLGTFTFDIPASADQFYVKAQKDGKIKIASVMLEKSIASIKLDGSADGDGTVLGIDNDVKNLFLNATIDKHDVTTVGDKKAIVVTADEAQGVISERVYGYPGTAAILSLEVVYGEGENVRSRYYSIDLTSKIVDGLDANVLYTVNATINGIGSGEGGSDNKEAITNLTVASQNWTSGLVINGGEVGN